VLEAPERDRASEFDRPRRVSAAPNRRLRRDFTEDFADDGYEDDFEPVARRTGLRVRFRGVPKTRAGKIVAGCVLVVCLGLCGAVFLMARSFLMHDERFVIPSSSAIEFDGNAHVTRAQLLSIFGEDVERNIFTVSLAERRAELERIPWVAHATVMRLLPNRMRVSIVERTPVAFVRQGSHIGLVDANGVLLDMPMETKPDGHYSFPVVTGISADEPLSTRAARMKIYERFTSELDGSGEKISEGLSEVDLSNPEDVKALIPDHTMDILVHFGDTDFLDRYRRFEEHLPEWRTVYPKLSSVDMRYERQVVLEMQPGSGVPVAGTSQGSGSDAAVPPVKAAPVKPVAVPKHVAPKAAGPKIAAAKSPAAAGKHVTPVKPKAAAAKAPVHVTAQSEVAFPVTPKKTDAKTTGHMPTAKHPAAAPEGTTQYYPPQVVHP
jgi:cell division protein FtsQ